MLRAPGVVEYMINKAVQEIFISGELVLNCVSVNDVGVEIVILQVNMIITIGSSQSNYNESISGYRIDSNQN